MRGRQRIEGRKERKDERTRDEEKMGERKEKKRK
jgi:hypothetical protein